METKFITIGRVGEHEMRHGASEEDGASVPLLGARGYIPLRLGWHAEEDFKRLREDERHACLFRISLVFSSHLDVTAILDALQEVVLSETEVDQRLLATRQERHVPVIEFFGYLWKPLSKIRDRELDLLMYVRGDWRPKADASSLILSDSRLTTRLRKEYGERHDLIVDPVSCTELLDEELSQKWAQHPNIGSLANFEHEVRCKLGPHY